MVSGADVGGEAWATSVEPGVREGAARNRLDSLSALGTVAAHDSGSTSSSTDGSGAFDGAAERHTTGRRRGASLLA